MSDSREKAPQSSTDDVFAELTAEDFSGATTFDRLSAEEKLLWLTHAASFALEARRAKDSVSPSTPTEL